MVVLRSDADTTWVKVCSNSAAEAENPPEPYVRLPFSPDGNCRTKLKKPTIAICTWYDTISTTSEYELGGTLPNNALCEVLRLANKRAPKEHD